MIEVNEILLRRKNKVTLPKCNVEHEATKAEKAMAVSVVKNIECLGFTLSRELFKNLLTYPKSGIIKFYNDLMPKLEPLVGADKAYNPMYPNFPSQVADADASELFVNAIIHYWSYGQLVPDYKKDKRMPLFEDTKMTKLTYGEESEVFEIFENLVSSKTSISDQDKEDIRYIVETYPEFQAHMPDEIPMKENVALIGKLILEYAAVKDASVIQKYFKTATDVLRLVTAMSDGDLSLATKTKYKKMRRCERRVIMDLLSDCGQILEDMYRYQYEWIRIGEIVHPFEFKGVKYNGVNDAFNTLRNKEKPEFLPAKIQNCINAHDVLGATKLLKNRPGDFARSLDKLLRDANDWNQVGEIIDEFRNVAAQVSIPVLLQVRQHFMDRNKDNPVRVFFPKGNVAKLISVDNELPYIHEGACDRMKKVCNTAIINKLHESKEGLGNVYIDPELKNFIVPFSQRSASNGGKILTRGSKLPMNQNAKVVRAFIWWTNAEEHEWNDRVDIDLSAAFYDEDWNYVDHVSYTRLRSSQLSAYHSGDITDGGDVNGDGVAEFLDFNIDKMAKQGRYVVFQVYNYTRQKFSDLPNCRFGWMQREYENSGEIFEPKTIDMSIDVNSASTIAIPVIFDCVKKEFIWCDMNIGIDSANDYCGGNNLESNFSGVTAAGYAMTHLSKPNLYNLVYLNALARGQVVDDRNQADIIFSNDKTEPVELVEANGKQFYHAKKDVKIVTAYDVDYIVSQLM